MLRSPKVLLAIACVLLAMAIGSPFVFPRLSDEVRGLLYGFYGLAGGLVLAGLVRAYWPDACISGTPALHRRYMREFMPPMIGYVVLLLLSTWLLKKQVHSDWLRPLVALLPLPPIALVLRAIVRYIRDTDELQQKIELAAVSIATALICLLYMAGGFLQLAKVIDIPAGVAMIWVFPLVCLIYGAAKAAVSRRYR